MDERKGRRNIKPIEIRASRVLTPREIRQMVRDVIRIQREEVERRRSLGIPDPEALGLTPDTRDSLYRTINRPRRIISQGEREF